MASELSVPTDWQVLPLETVMEAIIDYRGKSPEKTTFGIPLITAKIVKDGRILPADEFIAPEDYNEWMRRGLPKAGDVLITTEAPLGEVAQLDDTKVALAQRLIALRGKSDVLDNSFLKFLLQSNGVQNALKARSTGTTVSGIRQSELRLIQLPVPPIAEQHGIAFILGSLDDRIELNRKSHETLEAITRALFNSWFINFDPVRAKTEDFETGLPEAIAALFPDSFEDSELGEIPKGWEVGRFADIAVNLRRGVSPDQIPEETPYIALEHMPRKSIALSEWGTADHVVSGKSLFRTKEILFGKLRPYFHKVGIAPVDGVCSTDILVIAPSSPEWLGFVLGHASSSNFVEHTNVGSTGTKMPRTSWNELARYPIVLPPQQIAKAFNDLIQPICDQIIASIHQIRSLSSTRDTLLPKLISGEIRLEAHERTVGEIG